MIFAALKNYYRAAYKPLEYPKVVQFPVNDICNSRCQMCNIWKNKKSPDIDVNQARMIFSQKLFHKTESIGINGGEPTLRKDLPELINALYESMPKLKTISLISNGYNNKDIKRILEQISAVVASHKGHFEFMLSIDGYENIHDEVRGKEGNFKRIEDIISFVKERNIVDNFRVGCTVTKPNVLHLHDLYSYCISQGIYIKYRLGIPHQRLYTLDKKETYALTLFEKYEFAQFIRGLKEYETNKYQNFFYDSLFGQLVYNNKRKAGCDWKHRGATVTSKGELL
jgi:MoaA/NifB/PqqE/SkfB family radical SAM enzyme